MKIKQLLGMMALDANANEVGKIDDAEFDPKEGKINAITIVLKKNFISRKSTKKLQLKKLKKLKTLKKKWKKLKLKLLKMKKKQKKRLKKRLK
ncbi:PRC-barrel domain-containing protein [uncultured Methanobrevibacter sp.]|uniref:PRC-barrel domain-containing protein n=1 Tax=uncultured Methanobrevibacter sp. TaxID=253161 RepID=UPI0025FB93EA|nr:PRC-barrel domain-containing protein [uncultured Methanobrevibacter sp.]